MSGWLWVAFLMICFALACFASAVVIGVQL